MTIHAPGTGDVVERALEDDALRDIYRSIHTIAAVGASSNESKAAHRIPAYLAGQGFRVIGVSPRGGELFGNSVAESLPELSESVDVVDVFRPREEAVDVAKAAVASGARILWFQPGTETEEAVLLAAQHGMTVVSRRCMGATHGALGLGPGPD